MCVIQRFSVQLTKNIFVQRAFWHVLINWKFVGFLLNNNQVMQPCICDVLGSEEKSETTFFQARQNFVVIISMAGLHLTKPH